MKKKSFFELSGLALLLAACGGPPPPAGESDPYAGSDEAPRAIMRPKSTGVEGIGVSAELVATNHTAQLSYHDGPVITDGLNVYLIYYGNWASGARTDLLEDFVGHVGQSRWWAINTLYSSNGGQVSPVVSFAGRVFDSYSQGQPAPGGVAMLTDAQVKAIVNRHLDSREFPYDRNGIYVVVGSSDVSQQGSAGSYCTDFCAWHTYMTVTGPRTKFAFVTDAGTRCGGCGGQAISPNNDPSMDAMINSLAHEMAETATDPEISAWYRQDPKLTTENADLCFTTFGTTYFTPNFAQANQHLGTRDYLLQQNWLPLGDGFCGSSFGLKSDLVLEHRRSHSIEIWQVDSSTSVRTIGPVIGTPAGLTYLGAGDLDGNGSLDLIWRDASNRIVTWTMNGVNFVTSNNLDIEADTFAGVDDFDGDGRADLVFQNAAFNTLDIWHMSSPSSILSKEGRFGWGAMTINGVADIDGDGKADILGADASGNLAIDSTRYGGVSGVNVGAASFDGHAMVGRTVQGFVFRSSDGRPRYVYLDTSDPDGFVVLATGDMWPDPIPVEWQINGSGDFDDNGYNDIVWRNVTTGDIGLWMARPEGGWDFSTLSNYSLNWSIRGTGNDSTF